jgi:hypothetical protein
MAANLMSKCARDAQISLPGSCMRLRAMAVLVSILSPLCHAITLSELADIFDAMESSIEDVAVEYEWYNQEQLTTEDVRGTGLAFPVSREVCSFTTARPFDKLQLYSFKVDFSTERGETSPTAVKSAYNGEVFKQLTAGGSREAPPDGFVTRRTDLLGAWNLTPMGFTVFRFYREGLLSQLLREHPGSFRVVNDIHPIRQFRTIELDCVTEYGAVHRRVFLSLDHGYTPVRFEYLSPSDGALKVEVDVLSLREVSEGLWFPVKATTGCAGENTRNVYEVEEVRLNQHLSKGYFDLAFPPGTIVTDETAGVRRGQLPAGYVTCIAVLVVVIAGITLYRTTRRRSSEQ